MEVSARGWARDSGPKSIMKADFRDGYHYPGSLGKYGEGETYLKIRKNGEIDVSMGPNDLKLTGEYQVIVTLTKSESLTLFVESTQE